MKSQTPSDKGKDKLKALRILRRADQYKQAEKRERLIKRLTSKSGKKRVIKPAPKGRAELIARQKKGRHK